MENSLVSIAVSIGLATVVVLVAVYACSCCDSRKQIRTKKKKKDEEPLIERLTSCDVATQSEEKYEQYELEQDRMEYPMESVRGLQNLGNTCYFNSTMQALVHTNSVFREELKNLHKKGEVVLSVLEFFSAMQPKNSKPYSPNHLHHMFGKKSPKFADYRQHDSHECLRNFFDNIRKEERDNSGAADKRKVLTVVDSVFGGHFMTVYICKKCETPYHVCEAFRDISLSIMIDEKDLAVMNSARDCNRKKSRTVKLQTPRSQIKRHASQTDDSTEHKINKSPIDEPSAGEDSIQPKPSKTEQDSKLDDTLQQNTSDPALQLKSKTETANRHPTSIYAEQEQEQEDEKDEDGEEQVVEEEAELEYQGREVVEEENKDKDEDEDKEVEEEEETEEDDEEQTGQQKQELEEFEVVEYASETKDLYQETVEKLMTPLSFFSSPYLPNKETTKRKHVTIDNCLMYFTRKEQIHNEYLCNPCYGKHLEKGGEDVLLTSATKQTMIFNPPAILTLHLKRFELKPGGSVKRTDMITYGELLDVAPYCSSMCLRNDPPCQNIWYSLYGVVVHHGSTLQSGHHIAYVKIKDNDASFKKFLQEKYFDMDLTREQLIEMIKEKQPGETLKQPGATYKQPGGTYKQPGGTYRQPGEAHKQTGGTWYCMNDSWFHEVPVAEVLNHEAYLLFYERMC